MEFAGFQSLRRTLSRVWLMAKTCPSIGFRRHLCLALSLEVVLSVFLSFLDFALLCLSFFLSLSLSLSRSRFPGDDFSFWLSLTLTRN